MSCDKTAERLGFYIDGALDEHSLEEVEAHLNDCAKCRAELTSLQVIISAAREIEEIEPPGDLRMKIAAATTAIDGSSKARFPVFARLLRAISPPAVRWAVGTTAVAAAICIAVCLKPAPTPNVRIASTREPTAPVVAGKHETQPAPVRVAIAPPTARVSTPALHRAHMAARNRTVASAKFVGAAKAKPVPAPSIDNRTSTAPNAELANAAESDTTTATVTVSAKDLAAAEAATVATPARSINRSSLKLASQPVIKQEEVQKWVEEAKTEASMHRGDRNSVGLRLLSTRF